MFEKAGNEQYRGLFCLLILFRTVSKKARDKNLAFSTFIAWLVFEIPSE